MNYKPQTSMRWYNFQGDKEVSFIIIFILHRIFGSIGGQSEEELLPKGPWITTTR
jgi:hypothetical protein